MTWEILFEEAFNKLETLAKGEAEDSERVPDGALTYGDLRSVVRSVQKMGRERNDALRTSAKANDILNEVARALTRRG